MEVNLKKITDFVRLATGVPINAYSEDGVERKARFHAIGQSVLRTLAAELNLPAGSYDIRSNRGGVAVCGEVTLHGEWLYVQFSQNGVVGQKFMYRSCNGRKDYSGGTNHWMEFRQLLDLEAAVRILQRVRTRSLTPA